MTYFVVYKKEGGDSISYLLTNENKDKYYSFTLLRNKNIENDSALNYKIKILCRNQTIDDFKYEFIIMNILNYLKFDSLILNVQIFEKIEDFGFLEIFLFLINYHIKSNINITKLDLHYQIKDGDKLLVESFY